MQTMHPTLLIGPADWDPQEMPRAEFDARLAALWQDHPDAGGAIVFGNARDHAALAYLTHFTPKLEAALALIPRAGEAQMLIGGGANMMGAAKPLTFVERLAPLRGAAKTIADWANALPGGGSVVLIGGDAMPYGLRRAIAAALGPSAVLTPGEDALRSRMRVKSPRELAAVRGACAILAAAADTLGEAQRAGKGITDCVIDAEHAALAHGAQDVRSLFSLDGGRTLWPFDVPLAKPADPLQVYLAVQHDGYWAEGFVRAASGDDPLRQQASDILRAMLAAARPGVTGRELQRVVNAGRGPLRAHPLADGMLGTSIGLALDEEIMRDDGEARLEQGGVYSLRAGLLNEEGQGAIVSTMVAMTDKGCELL